MQLLLSSELWNFRYFGVVSFSGSPPASVIENNTCEGLTR